MAGLPQMGTANLNPGGDTERWVVSQAGLGLPEASYTGTGREVT